MFQKPANSTAHEVFRGERLRVKSDNCINRLLLSKSEIINHMKGYEKSSEDYKMCTDVDECGDGVHDCSQDAKCINTESSFDCSCNKGNCSITQSVTVYLK